MDTSTTELVAWLRARIDVELAVVSAWPDVLEPLPDGVPFWQDGTGRAVLEPRPVAVARLVSWSRILDFAEGMALPEDTLPFLPGLVQGMAHELRGIGTLGAAHLVRLVGVAFGHYPGYRAEWAPANSAEKAPPSGAHGT